jgi:hypothetical protein
VSVLDETQADMLGQILLKIDGTNMRSRLYISSCCMMVKNAPGAEIARPGILLKYVPHNSVPHNSFVMSKNLGFCALSLLGGTS